MTIRDEDLRQNRLVFYENHIKSINEITQAFLEKSKSKAAMMVDKEGHLVAMVGETSVDAETVSALVAASFAATQQIAKLLGEDEFSVLFHQGKNDSIQFSLVGERTLLVVVFNDDTTPGMVRLYAEQTVKKLNDLMKKIVADGPPPEAEGIAEDFVEKADEQLDELFGD